MGRAKERLLELQERGFGEVPDKYVCMACFENQGIKTYIKENAIEYDCSYCKCHVSDKEDPIAAPLEGVVALIVSAIGRRYKEPEWWDNEDGRYLDNQYSLDDVLWDLGLEISLQGGAYDELYNDLTGEISCIDYASRESREDNHYWDWKRFVDEVKHESRYFFHQHQLTSQYLYYDHHISAVQILERIWGFISSNDMVKKVKKGQIFYRARFCPLGETMEDAKSLGSPPAAKARFPNRMSPSGIAMFYGALDPKVAVEELLQTKHETLNRQGSIKIARFELLKDLYIVDLSLVPEFCLFDFSIPDQELASKIFLRRFLREFSEPIKKDGMEHIEYVPTQVVAEYIRHQSEELEKNPIMGIHYMSSCWQGVSCVLFLKNQNCVDKKDYEIEDAYLGLTNIKTETKNA